MTWVCYTILCSIKLPKILSGKSWKIHLIYRCPWFSGNSMENHREIHDFPETPWKIIGKSMISIGKSMENPAWNSQRPPTFVLSTCPWPTAPGAPRAPHRPQGGTAAAPAAPRGDARGRRAKGAAQVGPWESHGVSMGKWHGILPVVPHKAVAEVSKIGNL